MAVGTGIDRNTGRAISGFAHVRQSLNVLFSTPKGQRVMRRHVGSDLARFVDAPISPVTIIDIFAAVAEGVAAFEPRYRISRMRVTEATASGRLTIATEGVYYPRGHLGDFTVSEPATVSVPL